MKKTLDKIHDLKLNTSERLSVLQKFRIYTLLIMIIVGWLITYSLNAYAKQDLIAKISDSSTIFAKSISYHLKELKANKKLGNAKYKKFDQFVKEDLIAKKKAKSKMDVLLALDILDRKGATIYSSYSTNLPLSHKKYVEKAFANGVYYKVIKISPDNKNQFSPILQHRDTKEIVKIYTPLYMDNKEPLNVVGIYLDTTFTSGYIRKNLLIVGFIVALGLIFLYLLLGWFFKRVHNKISQKNLKLEKLSNKIISSLKQLEESYIGTMQALTMAVDAKDHYTAGHTFRVASFAREIGTVLGFTDEALDNLEKGARFHDIGKIGIRDSVLNKHGPLTKHEFSEMQRHTTIGAKILQPVKSLQSIVPIVRSHHERIDGTGYPDGLNGQNIPIEARIVAVADCFDAMTTDRPNRKAFPVAKAIDEIKNSSGTHFDEEVVDAFLIAYSGKQIWAKNAKVNRKKSA